jgi:energy-coupling factor transport system ATP-binding protein
LIEIDDVSFTYGEEVEIQRESSENGISHINLKIRAGECVVLCGKSGCGKSTLTRLINGLIPDYYKGQLEGEVLLDGEPIQNKALYEISKRVGSVFQNPRSQFFNVDTTSEIAFGCENQGIEPDEIKRRIDETVDLFRIKPLLDRSIFELSGGEKQKIACASVYTAQPDIFVLDEPSSNLDTAAIEELRKILAILKDQGKTIIIAEHRLYFLRELADRFVFMDEGKIKGEYSTLQLEALTENARIEMGLRTLFLENLVPVFNRPDNECLKAVQLNDLFYSYGKEPALHIHELSLPVGEVIAVIGPNGAGKSTLSRCLCGLEKRLKGRICLDGKALSNKERLAKSYMVMQDVNHQLFTESVLDEVLLGMKGTDEKKAEDILSDLDLLHIKELHPMSLSGGQKQRVVIASALSCGKEIIVLDEPTSGLDVCHMKNVAQVIRRLKDRTTLLLIITHDLEFILESCTYVLHMEQGDVIDQYSIDPESADKLKSFFLIP